MTDYDALKKELAEIAKLVHQFPEEVRPQVLDLLIAEFQGATDGGGKAASVLATSAKRSDEPKPVRPRAQGGKAKTKESYHIDRNLNLRGDKSIPSFRSFHDEKKPGSNLEFDAVAVYYLKKLLGLDLVTLDHAYTCYNEVSRRPPDHFKQSFTDTKNKAGWVEFDEAGNLSIPHRGVVFVEHDLPKSEKTKSGKAT